MNLPWWEFVVRAVVVYGFLLVSLRISGKRQIGQLSPFDLVLLLILSNAVQNSMNGGDNSLLGGLISATALIAINAAVAYGSYRSKQFEMLLEGSPRILVHNGKIDEAVMRVERLTHYDLECAMRQAGHASLEKIRFAVIENNGAISFLTKESCDSALNPSLTP